MKFKVTKDLVNQIIENLYRNETYSEILREGIEISLNEVAEHLTQEAKEDLIDYLEGCLILVYQGEINSETP